jgi:hypothetical protein
VRKARTAIPPAAIDWMSASGPRASAPTKQRKPAVSVANPPSQLRFESRSLREGTGCLSESGGSAAAASCSRR